MPDRKLDQLDDIMREIEEFRLELMPRSGDVGGLSWDDVDTHKDWCFDDACAHSPSI